MLSDILRAPSRAGEGGKSLSKSEEVGLAAEPKAEPEHCQTPDSARRIRPKYSREGKSQSLILLPGEDEDALGVRQDKRRQLEKSDGELPSAFEQRMQLMLHRIGVTKGPAADSKRQQSKDSEIKKAGSDGDIVDASADSPPPLKTRTHSVSTDAPFRSPRTVIEPGTGPAEYRPSWRSLGRSLPADQQRASSSELRHSCYPVDLSGLPEPSAREGWSSSLPRLGRSMPMTVPRRVSHGGEEGSGSPLPTPSNTEDNHLAPRLVAPRGSSHRAVSVHEEQLREPECPAKLAMGTMPLHLQCLPVLRWRAKHEALLESEAQPSPFPPIPFRDSMTSPGTTRQDWSHTGPEEPQAGAGTAGERAQALSQAVGTAQDSAAVDQRRVVPVQGEPARGP
ncbi:CARL2 protein, partial [Semnornis frantzii]|nr:CARL2 protein [Semnornis frantzii]